MGQSHPSTHMPTHSQKHSPCKCSSSPAAVEREISLDLFTAQEEEQLSTASALLFAAATSSTTPAKTNILIDDSSPDRLSSNVRTGSTRPCPSPTETDQPARKRQITSWLNHVSNLTSGKPDQRPVTPTTNLAPRQTPNHPLTPYGAANIPTGPPVDPMYPTAWRETVASAPPMCSSAQVSPRSLTLAMSLPEGVLSSELAKSRAGMAWANWENQIILSKLLGPNSPDYFIPILLREPRRTTYESELNPVWSQLSVMYFRGARTAAAIFAQWRVLVDTCKAILNFAKESGVDLYSQEFQNIELFVNRVRIVATWRRCVPVDENWGADLKLKHTEVSAWIHDPKNGWLAMMYRRLRESNVPLPFMDVSDRYPFPDLCSPFFDSRQLGGGSPAGSLRSGWAPSNPSPVIQAPIPQRPATMSGPGMALCHLPPSTSPPSSVALDDQIAENNELYPMPGGCSHGLEMLRNHREITSALASVANAKAEWIHSQAIETHAAILDRILERAQNDRNKRLDLALFYMRNTPATSPIRPFLDNWVYHNFFSSSPLDEVKAFIKSWEAQIGFAPVPDITPDAVLTPPLPPISVPHHPTQFEGAHRQALSRLVRKFN